MPLLSTPESGSEQQASSSPAETTRRGNCIYDNINAHLASSLESNQLDTYTVID
jgi:hypothetical protein